MILINYYYYNIINTYIHTCTSTVLHFFITVCISVALVYLLQYTTTLQLVHSSLQIFYDLHNTLNLFQTSF